MPEVSSSERVMIDRFLDSLRELPDVHAELDAVGLVSDYAVDAKVKLKVAGTPVTLLVEEKKAAYPRDVRQVLWKFKALSQDQPSSVQYVLVAESLSPGAKELLRAEHVGYYDSGGSLFLPVPGAYIYVEKPAPRTMERSIRSLFSGRRTQVLHTLLVHHQKWFGVTKVAEQAHVAPSTVSEVLGELERFEWLESRGQGPSKERYLREPGALLDAWAEKRSALRSPALRRYYVPGLKADTLIDRLGQVFEAHEVAYALSYEAAAQLYAPFLSGISLVRTWLQPGAGTDKALAELDARVVNEGANLAVIETKSAGELLFRRQVDGVWLASPIQVYLDLLRAEGRAKEMAEYLRRERIGF